MPRFDFQLEGVLNHRKQVEEQRQRELARVQASFQQLQNGLRRLDQSVQDAASDLRTNRLTGRVDLAFLAAHRRFAAATGRKALAIAQKMALVQKEIDQARGKLVEAAKGRKIIEKLRQKRCAAWMADMNRSEANDLDEIGTQLAHRQLAELIAIEAGGDP